MPIFAELVISYILFKARTDEQGNCWRDTGESGLSFVIRNVLKYFPKIFKN